MLQRYTQYKQMKHDLKTVVYESPNIDVFMSLWGNFISHYELSKNDWLNILFEERACWVPCYLKGFFLASMSTTQPCESMNAFFMGILISSHVSNNMCTNMIMHWNIMQNWSVKNVEDG